MYMIPCWDSLEECSEKVLNEKHDDILLPFQVLSRKQLNNPSFNWELKKPPNECLCAVSASLIPTWLQLLKRCIEPI